MQDHKLNETAHVKPARWYRDPVNVFLMTVILATGCLYLVDPIIEFLQGG